MKFALESIRFVLPPAVLGIIAQAASVYSGQAYLSVFAAVFAVIAVAILLFFRDPERIIPEGREKVLAPADGRVLLSDTLPDGRKRVAIFMSVFNVHINRCPVSGSIQKVDKRPGKYFNAATDKAEQMNARVDVVAESEFGSVAWRQISGLIARKICCRLKPGDVVRAGDRFGLIYFGSRMEVFLPASAILIAHPGEKVRSGETVIANLALEAII